MTLNKRCINCELLLEPKQEDFCSQECEQEFKDACDQELLTSLQSELPATQVVGQETETKPQEQKEEEFKQLLERKE